MQYHHEDYLAHHGIKGQKWGIRRFQNPDGTRTTLGKKRERKAKTIDHDTLIKSRNAKELYKYRDQLSDKELQDRLNRLRNEEALKQMANPNKKVNNGQSISRKVLSKFGEKTAEAIAVAIVGATVKKVIGKKVSIPGVAKTVKNGLDYVNLFMGANSGISSAFQTGSDFLDFFTEDWNP